MQMIYASDLSHTSQNVVLDLYNNDFQKHLDTTKVKLSAPKSVQDIGTGDTTVLISAIRPCDLNGSARYYYYRLDLSNYFTHTIDITHQQYTTIGEVLDAVHMEHGVNISPRDVYTTKIPDGFNDGDVEYTIKINVSRSHFYRGQITVKVKRVSLLDRIGNTMLNGFNKPLEE